MANHRFLEGTKKEEFNFPSNSWALLLLRIFWKIEIHNSWTRPEGIEALHSTPAIMCSSWHLSASSKLHNGWFQWTRWIIVGDVFAHLFPSFLFFVNHPRFISFAKYVPPAPDPSHHSSWWNLFSSLASSFRISAILKTFFLLSMSTKSIKQSRFRRRAEEIFGPKERRKTKLKLSRWRIKSDPFCLDEALNKASLYIAGYGGKRFR